LESAGGPARIPVNETKYSSSGGPACLIPAEVLQHLIEKFRVFIVDVLVEIGPRLQFFVADEALNMAALGLFQARLLAPMASPRVRT
jgi:hypothetical protein